MTGINPSVSNAMSIISMRLTQSEKLIGLVYWPLMDILKMPVFWVLEYV